MPTLFSTLLPKSRYHSYPQPVPPDASPRFGFESLPLNALCPWALVCQPLRPQLYPAPLYSQGLIVLLDGSGGEHPLNP